MRAARRRRQGHALGCKDIDRRERCHDLATFCRRNSICQGKMKVLRTMER